MTMLRKVGLLLTILFSIGNVWCDGDKKSVVAAIEKIGEEVEAELEIGNKLDEAQLKKIILKILGEASAVENEAIENEDLQAIESKKDIEIKEVISSEEVAEPEDDLLEEDMEEGFVIDDSVIIEEDKDWRRMLIEKGDTLAKAILILYPAYIIAKKENGSVISALIYMALAGVVVNILGSDF